MLEEQHNNFVTLQGNLFLALPQWIKQITNGHSPIPTETVNLDCEVTIKLTAAAKEIRDGAGAYNHSDVTV